MKFNMLGDANHAGQVRLSDVYTSAGGSAKDGVAASQRALYEAYNSLNSSISNLNSNIINMVYPVGSVYLSINNVDPSTFIGGTWELLSGGYVLKTITSGDGGVESNASATKGPSNDATGAASGNTGAASGNTGAASGNTGSTTLTKDQIPAHKHTMDSSGSCTSGAMSANASHSHKSNYSMVGLSGNTASSGWFAAGSSASKVVDGNGQLTAATNIDHKHTVPNHTHTMQNAGGGGGHTHSLNSHTHSLNSHTHSLNSHTHTLNNHTHITGMPANISIYAWKRTA